MTKASALIAGLLPKRPLDAITVVSVWSDNILNTVVL